MEDTPKKQIQREASLKEYLMHKQQNQPTRNVIHNDLPIQDGGYTRLKSWIEDSLDLFRNELLSLLYPVFLHIFLDLIQAGKVEEAHEFFRKHRKSHAEKKDELFQIGSVSDPLHLKENPLAFAYRNNKYHIRMGKYAFDLFINFLEENSLTYILKIVNQYLDIRVYVGIKKDEQVQGILGAENMTENDVSIDLTTNLISKECEDSILGDDQYRYDHLEAFVQQLKKSKEREAVNIIHPTPSQIVSEIEKLKDLCRRVSVNKNHLPSICCYTVHNTYEGLTCVEISNDSKILACGYKDSYIDIHSISDKPLLKLKTSTELGKSDAKSGDMFEEVGTTQRLVGHSGPVYGVKFFSTNKSLLSCSQDCTVRMWSLEMFNLVAVYKSHCFPVWSIDVSSNDFYFASGSADRQACIWSIISDKPERLLISALSDVSVVKFHPNGNYLFTGSCDYKIRMHEIQEGQTVRIFTGHVDTVTCIDVSHCGKFMVSGGKDKMVILWDISTGRCLIKFKGHEKTVYSVSFCYFGSVISSSGGDNSVRLWDRSDPKGVCLGVYYTRNTPLYCAKFGYRNIISCVGPFLGS
jgi:transcription initiation factor TFIID subunit 5